MYALWSRREIKNEGRDKLFEGIRILFKGWNDMGIRLIGTFGNSGHTPGGFVHHAIFEVDSTDIVGKMDSDFMNADWNHMVESFALHLGSGRLFIDDHFAD
ncbi:MAG TPA: hypothetical protein EYG12_10780 [Gammaproteobacteria bacterium]|nr:hypothetical protein [Gammaproteobacteria bacterium]